MGWEDILPKRFEAVYGDQALRVEVDKILERASTNPFFQRVSELFPQGYLSITSPMAGALGRVHDTVVEAAQPELVGRSLLQVLRVSDSLVRFPKAKKAKAYETAELASVWFTGEKIETQDVKADIEIRAGADWTRKFLEDASWNVLERESAEVGRAIGLLETERIVKLFTSIPSSELAGGGEVSAQTSGTLTYADVVKARRAVKAERFKPDCLLVSANKEGDLWMDDRFIHNFYYGSQQDKQRGVLGTFLNLEVIVDNSGATPDNKAFVIDRSTAAVMLLRRDIMVQSFDDEKTDSHGVVASERIGLGVLRSRAVARITGC
ncbi:MAG: hypothetical protein ACK4TI_01170 [Nitrososphaerales archaeon]